MTNLLDDNAIDMFNNIMSMPLEELKDQWRCHCPDEEMEQYKVKFARLVNELPELMESLNENELIYFDKHEDGKLKFIVFIGRYESVYQKLFQKYAGYDNLIKYSLKKYPEARERLRKLATGEFALDDDSEFFYIRLIPRHPSDDNDMLNDSQVQLYHLHYNDEFVDACNKVFSSSMQYVITDKPYKVWTIDECMENIDSYIKDKIDPNPIFGIEKFDSL